jgi:hypothetical protein
MAATIDAEELAKVGDHHVLRDVQPHNPQEWPEPEQPEIQGDACHHAEQGRDLELKWGPFHGTLL